jgi:hypothetical protein
MKGSEEVDRIKADVASSKRALEKLQSDYLSHQLKILELDGVKQQISGGRRHSKLNTHNWVAHASQYFGDRTNELIVEIGKQMVIADGSLTLSLVKITTLGS